MRRYALLYLLTFAGIPCWIGIAGFMFMWLNPSMFVMDGTKISEYFRLAGYVVIMLLPYVAIAVLLIRSFAILKGNGTRFVFVKSWRPVLCSITGALFWTVWAIAALEESHFVFQLWQRLCRHTLRIGSADWIDLWIVLSYFAPIITTLYFGLLSYHRGAYLLKQRRAD